MNRMRRRRRPVSTSESEWSSDDDVIPLKLLKHKSTSGESDLYKRATENCEFCSRVFNNRYQLLVHNAQHIVIPLLNHPVYTCSKCGHHSATEKALEQHKINKHAEVITSQQNGGFRENDTQKYNKESMENQACIDNSQKHITQDDNLHKTKVINDEEINNDDLKDVKVLPDDIDIDDIDIDLDDIITSTVLQIPIFNTAEPVCDQQLDETHATQKDLENLINLTCASQDFDSLKPTQECESSKPAIDSHNLSKSQNKEIDFKSEIITVSDSSNDSFTVTDDSATLKLITKNSVAITDDSATLKLITKDSEVSFESLANLENDTDSVTLNEDNVDVGESVILIEDTLSRLICNGRRKPKSVDILAEITKVNPGNANTQNVNKKYPFLRAMLTSKFSSFPANPYKQFPTICSILKNNNPLSTSEVNKAEPSKDAYQGTYNSCPKDASGVVAHKQNSTNENLIDMNAVISTMRAENKDKHIKSRIIFEGTHKAHPKDVSNVINMTDKKKSTDENCILMNAVVSALRSENNDTSIKSRTIFEGTYKACPKDLSCVVNMTDKKNSTHENCIPMNAVVSALRSENNDTNIKSRTIFGGTYKACPKDISCVVNITEKTNSTNENSINMNSVGTFRSENNDTNIKSKTIFGGTYKDVSGVVNKTNRDNSTNENSIEMNDLIRSDNDTNIKSRIIFEDDDDDDYDEMIKFDDLVVPGNHNVEEVNTENNYQGRIVLGTKVAETYKPSVHYDDLIQEEQLKCRRCGLISNNRYESIQHETSHMKIRNRLPILCPFCDRYLAGNHFTLRRHISENHPLCHQRNHHKARCVTCKLKYYNAYKHHYNYHLIYVCCICCKRFAKEKDRSQHVDSHKTDNLLIGKYEECRTVKLCEVCFLFTKRNQKYKYVELGDFSEVGKQQKCNQCEKLFFNVKVVRMSTSRNIEPEVCKKKKIVTNEDRLKNIQNRLKMLNKLNKF